MFAAQTRIRDHERVTTLIQRWRVVERPPAVPTTSLGPRARSESPRRARRWDVHISKVVCKRVLLTTLEIYDINEFGDIVYFQTCLQRTLPEIATTVVANAVHALCRCVLLRDVIIQAGCVVTGGIQFCLLYPRRSLRHVHIREANISRRWCHKLFLNMISSSPTCGAVLYVF